VKHWLDLLRLGWMTGADGRVSFWKMTVVAGGFFAGALAVMSYRSGGIVAALPWLVTLAIVLLFGAHSLQGLKVWAQTKPGPQMSAHVGASIDGAQMVELAKVLKEREPNAFTDDERG